MRPHFNWRLRSRSLELGPRTLIMGVLNVTPDSFSDGGLYADPRVAVRHALDMLDEGADIIDVGGESTRPGARVLAATQPSADLRESTLTSAVRAPVSAYEELSRVLPVIKAIKDARPDAIISIDTYKAEVARAAVEAGAELVNDVSALRWDQEMARTLAQLNCGAVLMHMRGRPEEWRMLPPPDDIVGLVCRELTEWSGAALAAGLGREHIAVDPGFGFGKSFDENYPLLARLDELHVLGFPLLAGTSRKSFLGRTLGRDGRDAPAQERLHGTLATVTAAVLKGAHLVRVHDVRPAAEAVRVADAILVAGA